MPAQGTFRVMNEWMDGGWLELEILWPEEPVGRWSEVKRCTQPVAPHGRHSVSDNPLGLWPSTGSWAGADSSSRCLWSF